jgi:hypothetical protein
MANATIWKYKLRIDDEQVIKMPASSIILSAHEQDEELCVWAWVDKDRPLGNVTFSIHGTGNPMGKVAGDFVGTVLMTNGLVWHVFTNGRVRR